MLVISRKADESIMVGDDIKVTIIRHSETRVTVGIDAPKQIAIKYEKPLEEIQEEEIT